MLKTKAIIHIGAGELQVDTINVAKSLNLYVIATDINKNAVAKTYADEFHCISSTDDEGLLALAFESQKKFEIIGAYGCNDLSVLPIAKINTFLGLKTASVNSCKISLDKSESKKIWLKNNVLTPNAVKLFKNSLYKKEQFSFPLIVKPKDSCGSQGIESVYSIDKLEESIKNAFKYSDEILLEDFIDGRHYDTIGVVWDGEFIPLGIGNRYFSQNPYHFPIWGHSPSDLNDEQINQAYVLTKVAALSLGLDFTAVKADLIYSKGKFYILEIAPRFHGDVFTSKMIPYSTSLNPVEILFKLFLGEEFKAELNYKRKVIWKAIFPKRKLHDLKWLKGKLKYLNIFFNEKKEFKKSHVDNTSLQGFIWFEVPEGEEFKNYYKKIENRIGEYIL